MSTSFLTDRNTRIKEFSINPEKCTGCMSCVLACSFHHKKLFDRKIVSVEVDIFGKEREMDIVIHRINENGHLACDFCDGEEEPLCAKYCSTKAIILNRG